MRAHIVGSLTSKLPFTELAAWDSFYIFYFQIYHDDDPK